MPPRREKSTTEDNNKPKADNDQWEWQCPFCRTHWSRVVITSQYSSSSSHDAAAALPSLESFDQRQTVIDHHADVEFADAATAAKFRKLWSIHCPVCDHDTQPGTERVYPSGGGPCASFVIGP